jgi:hypothetical protein
MKLRVFAAAVLLATFVGVAAAAQPAASASGDTITLDLALSEAVELDATVAVTEASVESGKLVVEGTIEGTATVLGATATIPSQPFTLVATATCRAGKGTLTLETTQLEATLDGQTLTIEPATVTASATCGRTPTLTLTLEPLTATIDGTTISTSRCTLTVSSPANTAIGESICTVQNLICQLADLLAQPDAAVEDLVTLLNQTLAELDDALTL